MNPIEERLHDALRTVGESYPAAAVPPPAAKPPRRFPWRVALVVAATAAVALGGVFTARAVLEPDDATLNAGPAKTVTVSLYLCTKTSTNPKCQNTEITADQTDSLLASAARLKGVTSARYESKLEAYERFVQKFSDNPDLLRAIRPGDIPHSIVLVLSDPEDAEEIVAQLKDSSGVDQLVNDQLVNDQLVNERSLMPLAPDWTASSTPRGR